MKRRNFLRLCAAAVVAPVTLLRAKPKPVLTMDCSSPMKWKSYYMEYHYSDAENLEMLEKFRKAFRKTKFQPPLYYHGIRIHYEKGLPL